MSAGKFPVEPGKTGTERTGAFLPEPPGNFSVEPEKPARVFRISGSLISTFFDDKIEN